MLRTVLAVIAMGAAVAIFSCSEGKLTGGNDAGARGGAGGTGGTAGTGGPNDASSDACPGTYVPATCFRACDGANTAPVGNSCPAGYIYSAEVCYSQHIGIDGTGAIPGNCTDGGADATPDACVGTLIPAWCHDNTN